MYPIMNPIAPTDTESIPYYIAYFLVLVAIIIMIVIDKKRR
jgi:hypothetical protein